MRRHLLLIGLVGLACGLGAPVLAGEHGAAGHVLLIPNDLTWTDAKSLPCGAKMAVLEGPLDKETPFTFRAKFPDGCIIPAHWHPSAEHGRSTYCKCRTAPCWCRTSRTVPSIAFPTRDRLRAADSDGRP